MATDEPPVRSDRRFGYRQLVEPRGLEPVTTYGSGSASPVDGLIDSEPVGRLIRGWYRLANELALPASAEEAVADGNARAPNDALDDEMHNPLRRLVRQLTYLIDTNPPV
jgi:hypothetical protein